MAKIFRVLEMKRKVWAMKLDERSILDYNDKASEAMTERRILPRDIQNKRERIFIVMLESVVKRETTSWPQTAKRPCLMFT